MSVVVPITCQGWKGEAGQLQLRFSSVLAIPQKKLYVPLRSPTFTNRCLSSISATPEVRHLAKMLAEEPREQGTPFVYNFISARQAQSLVFLHNDQELHFWPRPFAGFWPVTNLHYNAFLMRSCCFPVQRR